MSHAPAEPALPAGLLPLLQVSWCKLEVEVGSHKAVAANPTENKCAPLLCCAGAPWEAAWQLALQPL